ncbi:MAG: hypothetical protein LBT20_03075 [Clostridiales bacterium]|nr:hypothetical protein [Clostridiales bacterium]
MVDVIIRCVDNDSGFQRTFAFAHNEISSIPDRHLTTPSLRATPPPRGILCRHYYQQKRDFFGTMKASSPTVQLPIYMLKVIRLNTPDFCVSSDTAFLKFPIRYFQKYLYFSLVL